MIVVLEMKGGGVTGPGYRVYGSYGISVVNTKMLINNWDTIFKGLVTTVQVRY